LSGSESGSASVGRSAQGGSSGISECEGQSVWRYPQSTDHWARNLGRPCSSFQDWWTARQAFGRWRLAGGPGTWGEL